MSTPSPDAEQQAIADAAALKEKLLADANATKTFWSTHRTSVEIAIGVVIGIALVYLWHKL